jgi:shikimate dehydrogenase
VTLYARSAERAAKAAQDLGVGAAPWENLPEASWDVLVQATPLGRNGEEFILRRHLNGRMVLDAAYGAEATPLVRAARKRGLAVADGYDLLAEQAALQFARLTGRPAPREAMNAALQPQREPSSA